MGGVGVLSAMKVGVVSGHVVRGLLRRCEDVVVETPFGSLPVHVGKFGGHDVFVVYRHGDEGRCPPHRINARAMMAALSSCHVQAVVSVGTVGSLQKGIVPGDFVVASDFVDVTRSRPVTFFDECRVHVDMSEPFCPEVRRALVGACRAQKVRVHAKGVCLVTEGPRLETAAEIRLYQGVADVVGMTLVPEVVLAREQGLCFGSLLLVCNMAAGLQDRLTATEIVEVVKGRQQSLASIVKETVQRLPKEFSCHCGEALAQARL